MCGVVFLIRLHLLEDNTTKYMPMKRLFIWPINNRGTSSMIEDVHIY